MSEEKYLKVNTINHGEVEYRLYGEENEPNEEYYIITKGDISCLDFLIKDADFVDSKVERITEYTVYYVRFNFNKDCVWKEPLYQRFDMSKLAENSIIIEKNNSCVIRKDYEEISDDWYYFGIYGRHKSRLTHWGIDCGFCLGEDDSNHCGIVWEVMQNALCSYSSESDFKCAGAEDEVKKWFLKAGDIKDVYVCMLLVVMNMLYNRGVAKFGN